MIWAVAEVVIRRFDNVLWTICNVSLKSTGHKLAKIIFTFLISSLFFVKWVYILVKYLHALLKGLPIIRSPPAH